MNAGSAERIVSELLEAVRTLPGVGEWQVPHGFEVVSIEVDEIPHPFTSSLSNWTVKATLKVTLIYVYTTEKGTHLPADESNLEELRSLISEAARHSPHRIGLGEWRVETTGRDPELPRSGPEDDVNWIVTVIFDL